MTIHSFPNREHNGNQQPPSEPPSNMEARLTAVEQSIARIDSALPNLATKAELQELRSEVHKGFAEQTKWIVGTGAAGIAVFVTLMTFVLNNAVPKAQQPAPQPPAIIINVPPAAAAPAPAASR